MRKTIKKKKIKWMVCVIIILIIALELCLRLIGFTNAVLYKNDKYCGYRMVENQDIHRLGNHIITNEFSMRSKPLKNGEDRILVLGDSVVNGGSQIDHEELATTLVENTLQHSYGNSIRVLNMSTGGWGIDNCMGIIEEYGDFDCKVMVLVLNSHDLIGKKNENEIAGRVKNFPDHQYVFGIQELFDRYLIPRIKSQIGISEDVDATNTSVGNEQSIGWEFFLNYAEENQIPLIVYLHATQYEESIGDYTDNGKKIIELVKNKSELVCDVTVMNDSDYLDFIHLNVAGQEKMSQLLFEVLNKKVERMNVE